MTGKTYFVCSKCGRTADSRHLHGWLIGRHRDPEKQYWGEMVIRCPEHVTTYAIRKVVGGRKAIHK